MEVPGKFGGFLAIHFGRKLVVYFQLQPLVLGGRGCGRRNMCEGSVEIMGGGIHYG